MKNDTLSYIGKQLTMIRNKQNLSLQELADKSNLTKTYLWQMEKGDVNFSIKKLLSICDALSIDVSDLLPSSDKMDSTAKKINSCNNKELILEIIDYCVEIDNERDLELVKVLLKEMKK